MPRSYARSLTGDAWHTSSVRTACGRGASARASARGSQGFGIAASRRASCWALVAMALVGGCASTEITAQNLDPNSRERPGIPFYLPKPYLVVAKNVRYVPTPSVGLTEPTPIPDSFDATARELTLTGEVKQGRQLDLERKLSEESKFERLEHDFREQKLEQKFERLEEEKFQKSVEEKFQRTEEDKKSFVETVNRLTEDKNSLERRVERLENTTNTNANTNTNTSNTTSNTTNSTAATTTNTTTNANTTTTTNAGNAGTSGTVIQAEDTATPTTPGRAGSSAEPSSGPRGVAINRQVLGVTSQELVPAGQVPDGLTPETFYTYQIVYMPDLTQKYGLKIRHRSGEYRGTMNLVNGWMHTGSGPMYMRDSTKAAQTFAAGAAIGNVIDSLAGLGFATAGPKLPGATVPGIPRLPGMPGSGTQLQSGTLSAGTIPAYAELYLFEPVLKVEKGVKSVDWRLVTTGTMGEGHVPWIQMDRDYFGGAAVAGGSATGEELQEIVRFVVAELNRLEPTSNAEQNKDDPRRIDFVLSNPADQEARVTAVTKAAVDHFKGRQNAINAVNALEFKCTNCPE